MPNYRPGNAPSSTVLGQIVGWLKRELDAISTALRVAPAWTERTVTLSDGETLTVAHDLRTTPRHVSWSADGDCHVAVTTKTTTTITITLVTTPGAQERTVSLGMFA